MLKKINVNGISINYYQGGNADKQAILYIHGFWQSHSFWESVIKYFGNKYNLIALDLPGFGASDEPNSIWGVEEYSSFLCKFLEIVRIENPIVVGHSFGGKIATHLAIKHMAKALVVYSMGNVCRKISLTRRFVTLIVQIASNIQPNIVYHVFTNFLKPQEYKNNTIITKKRSQIMCDIFLKMQTSFQVDLSKVDCPTLLIYGEKDLIAPKENGILLKGKIATSKLVIMPNTTHFLHIEDPIRFQIAIDKFLSHLAS